MRRPILNLAPLVAVAVLGAASSATAQTEPIFLRCAKADGAEIGVFGVFQNNLWRWDKASGWLTVAPRSGIVAGIESEFTALPEFFILTSYVEPHFYMTEIDRRSGAYRYTHPNTAMSVEGICEPTREPRLEAPARRF